MFEVWMESEQGISAEFLYRVVGSRADAIEDALSSKELLCVDVFVLDSDHEVCWASAK